ncbi:MAG: ABC transporter ATP-binding protein [Defluviitaleaceae bacterium]|nr:ABC transporter ATP-binding protein [Defluviitaleaceae bacterium]
MIEFKSVSVGYKNIDVIQNMSINFPNGKITVLIGSNGCGKSTLLSAALGRLRLSLGEICVDGNNLLTLPRKKAAQKISLLPQSRTIPDITVEAFVLHGRFPWLGYPRVYRVEDKVIVKKAMERVNIIEKRHELLAHLSGGERQKAYLAMLLAQNTSNILLDEPTTYLDIAHQLELLELMKKFKNDNKCVIAVLHDLDMAFEIADQIAVLKNGSLLKIGTPKEVFASKAVEEAFGVKITILNSTCGHSIINKRRDGSLW